jgi:peptidoglycan/xylan/chitin deacetylase (PgdA/CDA1 family)
MTEPTLRARSWTTHAKRAALTARVFDAAARLRPWPGAVVLCYHGVRPGITVDAGWTFGGLHVPVAHLAEHLEVVRRLGTPVTLDQLRASLDGGRALPRRAIHVTFDDGYRSVLTRALPLLERAGVPATVFVCRRPCETRTLFWFDAMARQQGDDAVVALRDGHRADWDAVLADWSIPASEDDSLAPLSPGEIARLADHRLVEVGSHTDAHLPLAQLEPGWQRREIERAVEAIESWTGRRPRSFAYPIGRPGVDFDRHTVAFVAKAGVDLAFTTIAGCSSMRHAALEQPRFVMVDGIDGAELAYRLAWIWRA